LLNENDCCDCQPKNWKYRFDDSEEMYPKRYAVYQELTQPIVDQVLKLPNCITLQSLNNPNVTTEVLERINALLR
jgi:adenylate kinase family enzyme